MPLNATWDILAKRQNFDCLNTFRFAMAIVCQDSLNYFLSARWPTQVCMTADKLERSFNHVFIG